MSDDVGPEFFALQAAVAGRYSLVREIGRGGMGVVFVAREVALDRLVAIKLLPAPLAAIPVHRERFLREARTAASLAHPHIVPIHAVEAIGDVVFFVMAYIPGESLGARLRRTGALPGAVALRIAQEVAWALSLAHARGVIHRDIKPDNILLEEGTDRAVVTDFGIARAGDAATDTPPGGIGTLHYMSPEQALGGTIDARSDLYSLGVTAFHAVTGRKPFEGEDGAALFARQAASDAPAIITVAPLADPRFAAVIDRAIRYDPAERWPTVDAMAEAIGEVRAATPQVPVVLRQFARHVHEHSERLGISLGIFATSFGAYLLLFARNGMFDGLEFAIIGVTAAFAVPPLLGNHLWRIRQLLRAGYDRRAALMAIGQLEAEDQATSTKPAGRRLPHRVFSFLEAIASIAIGYKIYPMVGSGIPGFACELLLLIGIPLLAMRRALGAGRDGRSWWTRVLKGRVGGWLFKVAGLRLRGVRETPTAGAPTALALGSAVDTIFARLPAEQQKFLADVPDLVRQFEALALDRAAPQRETALIALEKLRLDLLRVRAGEVPVASITEALDQLRDVGFRVDATVEARELDLT